jgi:2-oxoglutarate ferredoxin oxidoreductase subunit beta
MWCPGCGHGTILNTLLHAVDELGLDKKDLVMTSGIGCSARISGYVDFHSLHTLHGRALAFATGVKLSKPELTLIVPMGDGDALAIGGNHFIHAARRNIDITAIVMNNRIYGMTGGQFSPLSGRGILATTAPYRTIDNFFDVVELARAAGASFVARSTTYHARETIDILKKAITHKGFSVVEILSQCPTYFGRKNKQGEAAQMMESYRHTTAKIGSKALEEDRSLLPRGIFVEEHRPEYCEEYDQLIAQAAKGARP